MTIQELFNLGIKMGIAADPRGKAGVDAFLVRRKKEYDGLSDKKKAYFDKEMLTNPFADSGILFGDPQTSVKTVLAGIDMDTAEVLLADRLSEKGQKIDAIISHHPSGHAFAALHEVMDVQVEMLADLGIPINIAEHVMNDRAQEVMRAISPHNHGQALDAARLLGIPYLAMHTVWDNMGHEYVQKFLDNKKIETVGDVYDAVMDVPEYQAATKLKAGPFIASGSANNRAGKVAVGFTGGTEGSKEVYELMARYGVGTLVEMHLHEDRLKEAKKHHMNVIVTGHMSSDSIGANLFFDEVAKNGIAVIAAAGFIRVKR